MAIPFRLSPEHEAKFQAEWKARTREPELTPGQKLALLTLLRTELAKLVIDKLRKSTVRASAAGYRALASAGLAMPDGRGFHRLTPLGRVRATSLIRTSAKELGVHFFVTGGTRFQSYVACTCGWSYYHSRNEGHERSAFARRMGEHLSAVGQTSAAIVTGSQEVPSQSASDYAEVPFQ